jgi:hypothetical protein
LTQRNITMMKNVVNGTVARKKGIVIVEATKE